MTGHVEAPRSLLWAAGHSPTSFMQLRWGNLCLVATVQTEGKRHAPCQWAVPPGAPSTGQLCHEVITHGLSVQQKLGKNQAVASGTNMQEERPNSEIQAPC